MKAFDGGSLRGGVDRFFLDIDDDKKPELFAVGRRGCGTGGCEFHVFRSSGSCNSDLGPVFLSRDDFELLNSTHNGVHDIKVCSHMSASTCSLFVYQFNGLKYAAGKGEDVNSKEFYKHCKPTDVRFEHSDDGKTWEEIK